MTYITYIICIYFIYTYICYVCMYYIQLYVFCKYVICYMHIHICIHISPNLYKYSLTDPTSFHENNTKKLYCNVNLL